jgi:hypothetical protein
LTASIGADLHINVTASVWRVGGLTTVPPTTITAAPRHLPPSRRQVEIIQQTNRSIQITLHNSKDEGIALSVSNHPDSPII